MYDDIMIFIINYFFFLKIVTYIYQTNRSDKMQSIDFEKLEEGINTPGELKILIQEATGSKSKSWATLLILLIQQSGGVGRRAYKNAIWITDTARMVIGNINSFDQFLTKARKAWPTSLRTDPKIIRKALSLTESERNEKVRRQAVAKHKMQDNVENIKSDVVLHAIEEIRDAETVNEAVILCMLTTGRRMVEVLKVTGIPPESKTVDHIIIDKVGKDKKGLINNLEVPLIGIKYPELVKAWKKVRDYIESKGDSNKTNEELTNKYNPRVNRRIARLFPSIKKPTSHTMRKIYGAMAYRLYGGTQTRNRYIGRVLGHVPDSSATQNYTVVKIRDPPISTPPQVRKTVDKINADVKKLETAIDKINIEDFKPLENKVKQVSRKVKKIVSAKKAMPAHLKKLIELAEDMENAGEKVTHRSLRKRAGVGSVRISEYFDYLKAERLKDEIQKKAAKPPLPPRPSAERIQQLKDNLIPRKEKLNNPV